MLSIAQKSDWANDYVKSVLTLVCIVGRLGRRPYLYVVSWHAVLQILFTPKGALNYKTTPLNPVFKTPQ